MKLPIVAALGLLALGACGDDGAWKGERATAAADAAVAGYVAPPEPVSAAPQAGGAVLLTGQAAPGARVRLGSPTGQTMFADADKRGAWSLAIPAAGVVRLFGLSMMAQGRTIQSEGYLLVTPEGQAAQLRAGAGAASLAQSSAAPRILAVDYDRDGGAMVSGVAAPETELGLRVDRAPRGEARADARGRFSIALSEPLSAGSHTLEVSGESGQDVERLSAARAAPLSPGPYRAERTAAGWRIDWITPGGGIQTTVILRPAA